VECEKYDPLTGLDTQFQTVDKLVNLGDLAFSSYSFGAKTGTLGFQYPPIDPRGGIADDQFSLILNFDPDRNGPYSGEFEGSTISFLKAPASSSTRNRCCLGISWGAQ